MESKFMVPLILLLSLATIAEVASNSLDGAFPTIAEAHWKTVLPDTRMPVVINELLHPAEKSHSAGVIIDNNGNNGYNIYGKEDFTSLRNVPDATLFFLEDDLKRSGTRMHIQLSKRMTNSASFLPQSEAKSIPFSTADLPNTLSRFSIKPNSNLALRMQETLQQCEAPALKSEEKLCATSLESMVDFVVSKLGTNKGVQARVTVLEDRTVSKRAFKWYMVAGMAEEVGYVKTVNCHPQTYAYLTYYCHSLKGTRTYVVPFVGDDGTNAEVVAECHSDTSEWDAKHISFKMLHVKPGSVPICHALPEDSIVWMTS
ncbi:BURP domain-containing protein 5 [Acorus calamus]|uniref:BURP domain-containing protein 5 n=1 Tax=Acorus calamus TaxID=4465 RepID=A0AAV9F7E5_ACOCL|nr:BURP domain-containing protein 5 [Acorus calamus]